MEDTDRERELGRNENKLFGILQGFTYWAIYRNSRWFAEIVRRSERRKEFGEGLEIRRK
jgi:hypothetical protein